MVGFLTGLGVVGRHVNVPDITFLTTQSNSTTGTNRTFTGVTFGATAADRVIILFVSLGVAATPVSATIAGVSATLVFNPSGSGAWFVASVPTGASGNTVVTFSGSFAGSIKARWYRMTGHESAIPSFTESEASGVPEPEPLAFSHTYFPPGGARLYGLLGNFSANGAYTLTGLLPNPGETTETATFHISAAGIVDTAAGSVTVAGTATSTSTAVNVSMRSYCLNWN